MLYLSHDSIRITQLFPPFTRDFADEIPSPNRNDATLIDKVSKGWWGSGRYKKAHNDPTFGEIIHGRGKRIFDSDRKILEGTVTETIDGHRHDIDHEMAEEVKALERLLPTRKLEHLERAVRREMVMRVKKNTSTSSQVESWTSGWKRLM